MATEIYQALTEQEKREVSMYGCTEYAASMMSDAQEMMAYETPDFNTIEDQRQLLNRAKWVLFEYILDQKAQ
jgi:hypothetical protein